MDFDALEVRILLAALQDFEDNARINQGDPYWQDDANGAYALQMRFLKYLKAQGNK